jgi:hypothetical protein
MPVTGERKGVALMSGFSPSLLKVFMGQSDLKDAMVEHQSPTAPAPEEFNPVNIMKRALQKKSFEGLVVLD